MCHVGPAGHQGELANITGSMPSVTESAAIADLVNLLYEFLPASGAEVTFATVAEQCGVAEFWPADGAISKAPKIKMLLEGVLSLRRDRFCSLIEGIISAGLSRRRQMGKPMTRADASRLKAILDRLGFEIPELHSSSFLDALEQDPTAPEPPSPRPPMKHTILFLAANPLGTNQLALDREAREIQIELERSGSRDRFEFVTRWAVEPLDLLRELRRLKPTVVHFSGHGGLDADDVHRAGSSPRDVSSVLAHHGGEPRHGLYFQGPDGGPQLVSTEALEKTFGAAGASVKLVVLNACYSDVQAQAIVAHVGCVVGMIGSIRDDAARSFAIGFYGGLGERESIASAYKQGCAAISLQGIRDHDRPQLAVRPDVDASKLVLAADPS
jgi:CHAT domain